MKISDLLIYDQNWNIGFCDLSAKEFVRKKGIKEIHWLKHPYKDRWFADPFILDYTDNEIRVLVEECPVISPKGIICELLIDRKTMRLKERYVLLELDTHLSYPYILHFKGRIYVCPENGASSSWNIYEYDSKNHKLVNPKCLISESIADASILESEDGYYMIATKFPDTQEKTYLYKANEILGCYQQIFEEPIAYESCNSRPGGSWIRVNDELYRPAQNCKERYGGSLAIMKVDFNHAKIIEQFVFELMPTSGKYRLGLHTINFKGDLCVVDGCSYLYPFCGRIYELLRNIKRTIFK